MTKLIALCALVAAPAFASPQTHHCEKDGATVEMHHKDCTKAGGKWVKNGAPAADKAAAAPAATPAPATK